MLINLVLLFTILGSLIIGFLVFLNNRKTKENKVFLALAVAISLWVAVNLLTNVASNEAQATIFARLTVAPGIFIAYFIWLFSYFFPESHPIPKKINILFITLSSVFALLSPTPFNILKSNSDGTVFEPGPVYWAMTIVFVVMLVFSFVNYYRFIKKTTGKSRQQAWFMVFGLFFSAVPGALLAAVFPLFGINSSLSLVPVVTLFLLGFTAYAMIRHSLFDIRFVVARSVTYLLSIGFVAVIYGFTAFRFANVFLNNLSPQLQQTFYVFLTVVLAFAFAPLKRFFERVTNRIFYRDHYDAQKLVTEIGRILASQIELESLSRKVLQELISQIKIDRAEIVVFGDSELFLLGSDHGKKLLIGQEDAESLSSDSTDFHKITNGYTMVQSLHNSHAKNLKQELRKLGRLMVVAEDLEGGERKEVMQKYGVNVSLALRTSEQFLGYLLLSEKKSGDIYNEEDVQTLKIIANELSVAVQNAKAFMEIKQFNITLQDKVIAATGKLRKANDQLKELDKAKDEFISMASHQLRTPLTTVKGYASMLEEGDFGKLSKTQQEPVEQALDGANRMARLIDDLLNVSRMDANRFFLEVSDVDLNTLVKQEIDQLQSLAASKKVELIYTPPKQKIPIIKLDEMKTRQVIMNITDNAIHYSQPPTGGGKVQINMKLEGDSVLFEVHDNGIGVPKDQQDKLFTKMFRAENAKGVRPDGTGLGLYLVKRVVQDQGGSVVFESVPGKGSMFGFHLPLSGVPKEMIKASQAIGARVTAHQK